MVILIMLFDFSRFCYFFVIVTESTYDTGFVISDDDFLRPNFLPYPLDLIIIRGGYLIRLDSYKTMTVKDIQVVAKCVVEAIASLHEDDLLHYRVDERHVYLYFDELGRVSINDAKK